MLTLRYLVGSQEDSTFMVLQGFEDRIFDIRVIQDQTHVC